MRHLILAGVAAVVMMAPATALADDTIVIKFSHVVANDTPKGKGALKFKELAEKYTNGKVKIEVYPNSSLYKDKEEIEALQLGSVQMLAPSTAKFAPLGVKEFEALDLPWLFKDEATYTAAMKGQVGQVAVQEARSQGHHRPRLLGQRLPHGLRQPAADQAGGFPGPEIRISGSKIADQYFRNVGSIPQIMAFSEVYQALQTGVVDGCENTPSNYTDAEVPRGAEGHHRVLSRASAICRDRQLEILERTAGRCPRSAREGDGGGDRLHQLDRDQGKRGRACGDQEVGQDHAALPDRRADARRGRPRCRRPTSGPRAASGRRCSI